MAQHENRRHIKGLSFSQTSQLDITYRENQVPHPIPCIDLFGFWPLALHKVQHRKHARNERKDRKFRSSNFSQL